MYGWAIPDLDAVDLQLSRTDSLSIRGLDLSSPKTMRDLSLPSKQGFHFATFSGPFDRQRKTTSRRRSRDLSIDPLLERDLDTRALRLHCKLPVNSVFDG